MCGIAGVVSKDNTVKKMLVAKMCQRMVLRGPDHQEVWGTQHGVTLGHCRLAILDLNTGNQPMTSGDKKVVIVFNGEIYNFLDIRQELEEKNHYHFATTSDTEVIIGGYQTWGIDGILSRLEGMFAFALFDIEKDEIFIARDKFGEKPLYYYTKGGELYFASELKAFDADLNKFTLDIEAANFYFALGYIPAPYCIYKEIRKLEPGHYMHINTSRDVTTHLYYALKDHISRNTDSFDAACQRIRDLVNDSVRQRMIADVPMGAFLSGGVDSSIICCTMPKYSNEQFDTFSIGFDESEYDESNRAKIVADKINSKHHLHILKFEDVVDSIDDIIGYYDEPFGDSSAIPSYYVAMLAHKDVKAVLTGDSADEIFAGYEKYLGRYYADKYKHTPKVFQKLVGFAAEHTPITQKTSPWLRKANKLINTAKESDFDIYYNLMCLGFPDYRRKELLKGDSFHDVRDKVKAVYDECPNQEPLDKEQYCDVRIVLEGCMFPKVDRACMHNSLENRTPFLDSRIVEYALSIKPEYRLNGKNKKVILKEAFKEFLPEKTTHFSKRGFGAPTDYWFKNDLREEMVKLINRDFIEDQGIFNYEYLQTLFDDHLSGKENNKAQLWNIYVFQKWYLSHSIS